MKQRYVIQLIEQPGGTVFADYRITDTRDDSRIATCFLRENAQRVASALNEMECAGAGEDDSILARLRKLEDVSSAHITSHRAHGTMRIEIESLFERLAKLESAYAVHRHGPGTP